MSILTPAQLQRIRRFQEGGAAVDQPYIAAVTRQDEMMDPITQQLLLERMGKTVLSLAPSEQQSEPSLTVRVARLSFPRKLPGSLLIKLKPSS
jgi:hypothetical protein